MDSEKDCQPYVTYHVMYDHNRNTEGVEAYETSIDSYVPVNFAFEALHKKYKVQTEKYGYLVNGIKEEVDALFHKTTFELLKLEANTIVTITDTSLFFTVKFGKNTYVDFEVLFETIGSIEVIYSAYLNNELIASNEGSISDMILEVKELYMEEEILTSNFQIECETDSFSSIDKDNCLSVDNNYDSEKTSIYILESA